MVTETGLHVEITADIAQFDAKLKAVKNRLEQTSIAFNPLNTAFATTYMESEKAKNALARLERETQRAQKAIKTTGTSVAATAAQLIKFGQASGKPTQNVANLTAQINDIGVMLQAGQSPFMLAIQQGTQMNQVLDNLGTTGTARLKAVGEAIVAAIKPANLLTVAVIAGGAALFQWGQRAFAANKETTEFKDSLDSLNDITSSANAAIDILKMSTYELAAAYGLAGERVQELAKLELELIEARASRAFFETVVALDEISRAYSGALRSGRDYRNAMARIEDQIGLTDDAARAFAGALKDTINAESTEEQIKAFQRLQDILELNNIEISELPPEIQEALTKMVQLEQATINVNAALARAAEAGANLATSLPSTPFSGDISDLFDPQGNVILPGATTDEKDGGKADDPLATDLQALQDSLKSAEELQIEAFNRQQALLEEALAKKKLTEEEYFMWRERAQGEHQAAMTQIDAYAYGNNVDKLAAFMGDAASVLAEGNEDMLKISRAFAAAQALISTLQGAAKELEKGTFGFAQAAAVIAKGMSFITAINGVTAGSASAGTAAAADTTGTTSAGTAAATTSAQVAIQLSGGDMFSRDQVISLINSINEAVEDGAELRLV
jgi:hypothetical protein